MRVTTTGGEEVLDKGLSPTAHAMILSICTYIHLNISMLYTKIHSGLYSKNVKKKTDYFFKMLKFYDG